MDLKQKEERRKLVAEHARKQLADGSWPEVMAVFAYPTPRAPRVEVAEWERLKGSFEAQKLHNMSAFVGLALMDEQAHNVTMSYNFSMRRRDEPDISKLTPQNVMAFLGTPDILVGTRMGIEGAYVWLKNFSEAMIDAIPEAVQVFDKIFGEAVAKMQGPSTNMTLGEMAEAALGGKLPKLEVPNKQ